MSKFFFYFYTYTNSLILFFLEFGSLEAAMKSRGDLVRLLKTVFPMLPRVNYNARIQSEDDISQLPESDKFSRTKLLLSPHQLLDEQYPVPLQGKLANESVNFHF